MKGSRNEPFRDLQHRKLVQHGNVIAASAAQWRETRAVQIALE